MGKLTRVYQYGLLAPTQNADLVRDRLGFAHRYRNMLTEIERGQRDAIRAAQSALDGIPALVAAVTTAEAKVEDASRALSRQRAKTRTCSETEEQKQLVKDTKAVAKEARRALMERRSVRRKVAALVDPKRVKGEKRARKRTETEKIQREANLAALTPESVAKALGIDLAAAVEEVALFHEVARIKEAAKELQLNARKHSGLASSSEHGASFGTYLLVEEAATQSAKTTPLYKGAEPGNPKFSKWTGEGRIGVQIQRQKGRPPFTCSSAFGNDTRLRIDPVDERAWHDPKRGERRRLSRTVLHLRVGADGRQPIWASWPMVMHRPLPEGEITWVAVSVRRIGPREHWTVEITVDEESRPTRCGSGAVAIHLGWLKTEKGLRVATTMTEAGVKEDFLLDEPVSGLRKADSLRSIRDKNFEIARDALITWFRANDMPSWVRFLTVRRGKAEPSRDQALNYLGSWKSPGRLAALTRRWRDERWTGDSTGYDALEVWRRQDFHLWQWETSQRQSSVRQRRDNYRCFAADLTDRFGTVILDDTDYSALAEKKAPEEGATNIRPAQSNRQLAAVGDLRLAIHNAASARGAKVVTVKAAGVTITCPECLASMEEHRDDASHMFACSSCTFVRDLDTTALLNQLRRAGFDAAVDAVIRRGKQIMKTFSTGMQNEGAHA